jgi:hypothetical protein
LLVTSNTTCPPECTASHLRRRQLSYKCRICPEVVFCLDFYWVEVGTPSPSHVERSSSLLRFFFHVCVTVHHWYSSINNQLDATITIYWKFQSVQHDSSDNFAHPQEH